MTPETAVEWAVLAGVLIATFIAMATHRSPMGEPSLAMTIAEWWRSRKE